MEDSTWAATGFFSPSKARIAQAQARDWSFIDAWLAKKYIGGKTPAFERDEDTLQVLLALATLNESADEQRVAVERVEKATLQAYSKQATGPEAQLHKNIMEGLDAAGQEALTALASAAVQLDASTKRGVQDIAARIVEAHAEAFQLEQLEARALNQCDATRLEGARLSAQLVELRSEAFQLPADTIEETAEWTKGVKQLRAKIGEYDERLGGMATSRFSPSMNDVRDSVAETERLLARLAELESANAAFQNLPTNPTAARRTVEQAREELRHLIAERDGRFEALLGDG